MIDYKCPKCESNINLSMHTKDGWCLARIGCIYCEIAIVKNYHQSIGYNQIRTELINLWEKSHPID